MYDIKNQGNDSIFTAGGLPPTVLEETAGGRSAVDVRTLAFEQGIIHFTGEINDELVQKMLLLLHIAAIRKMHLTIYITSPGGSVSPHQWQPYCSQAAEKVTDTSCRTPKS